MTQDKTDYPENTRTDGSHAARRAMEAPHAAAARRRRRRLCMVLDVAMLLAVCGFVAAMLMRTPSHRYDVDRSVYPVKGIDLSAHNGDVDFVRIAADSVSFVMLKVTEGTDFCDAKFGDNYSGARDCGLKVGAYHYFRFDTPGEVQASHFLETLAGRELDMPLAIDVEKWGNASTYDVAEVKRQLRLMLSEVRRHGYPVLLYTNRSGYHTFVEGDFDTVPIWICALSSHPTMGDWTLWQHSHRSKVDGVSGVVDVNTYNGSRRDFESWAKPYTVLAQ